MCKGRIINLNPNKLTGISLPEFYMYVATEMGVNPEDHSFDCREIDVSNDVQHALRKTYEDKGLSDFSTNTLFAMYGPKKNYALTGYDVKVFDGFLCRTNEKLHEEDCGDGM